MRFPTMATDGLRRPIVSLIVEAATGARLMVDVLVDTGSDRTLLPPALATKLGVDLTTGANASVRSILGADSTFTLIDVVLELRQFPEVFRWKTVVGFLSRPMTYGILGTKGFFEFFTITYNWTQQIIDIKPAGPLPQ